jgi:hypothetical protein
MYVDIFCLLPEEIQVFYVCRDEEILNFKQLWWYGRDLTLLLFSLHSHPRIARDEPDGWQEEKLRSKSIGEV